MLKTIFATKKTMTQAWDKQGRRLAITKLKVEPNYVVGEKTVRVKTDKKLASSWADQKVVEIGYGAKKLKNMSKPLRVRLEKASLKEGVRQIKGLQTNEDLAVGSILPATEILTIGSIVKVRGTTKGRGFAGAVKRWGFHGGPKTHGQSDRWRAVGSIGNRTTPGRVWLGKKMPGHFGNVSKTVSGLTIAHYDDATKELWLTGAIPGSFDSLVEIVVTDKQKKNFALDKKASGIKEEAPVSQPEEKVEEKPVEADSTPAETQPEESKEA
ncbi:MAG: 50S ribosomal protein L3 [bacterium]|nr:50S ribosomal protein L3 [bacterium]